MEWNDRSILVTGAAGFIGSHVCRALLARNARVVGIDNLDPFYDPAIKERADERTRAQHPHTYSSVRADINDTPRIQSLLNEHRVDGIIHLAAKAGVRPSIEDPIGYAHANVTGTASVLHAASRAGCARVIIASSSSVYGNNTKVPFAEDDPVENPISPYAATKRACELLGYSHHRLTGTPIAMLRFFTVYGPDQRPDLAISKFMKLLRAGKPIPMFGNGNTSRDYTFIDDIVSGVLASYQRIDTHGYRIWNLGGNAPVTLNHLIASIGRVTGTEPAIEHRPPQPGDVERTWADLTRSATELGYGPRTTLESGLRAQWEALSQTGR
ncbi:MAG: GDP-mannose 4,6-dehydratase [Phycisphaeraceae bacterium]|nr:GDP-mannose 4,6-dehydratase [Phycisphaeraceae bacterium]MBX3366381.1 GDP-mannose 4,6-dehydratase [Phycisphaeraceae bacterium]